MTDTTAQNILGERGTYIFIGSCRKGLIFDKRYFGHVLIVEFLNHHVVRVRLNLHDWAGNIPSHSTYFVPSLSFTNFTAFPSPPS